MPYRQDLTACFADAVGGSGLDQAGFDRTLEAARPALDRLRRAHRDGALALLGLPERRDDLDALAPVARRFRESFDRVVVLGTGGSSLGAKTLYALADRGFGPGPGAPALSFVENVDPDTFEALLAGLDLGRTGFLAVSKSGTTAETLTQLLVCMDALRRAGRPLSDHVAAITEPADSPLRRLAEAHALTLLDHDPGIGGRYSVLSVVGLLPAAIAGLDAGALRAGAAEALAPVLAGAEPAAVAPALGAAASVALSRRGAAATVLMPYADRLAAFSSWFRQLWAESLGKDGAGTTPIRALGTVDQHSQLQLYLDGPADKMFTVVTLAGRGAGPEIPGGLADDPALAYLRGRHVGDLMDAEQRATIETLVRRGRPVRVFALDRLDERAMGALLMHFMLETVVAAELFGVDPFDQPAVEDGKRLTRQYLADMGAAGRG